MVADRQESEGQDFQDPLENYDPRQYDDPLERALAEEPVSAIETSPFTSASADLTVEDAIKMLAEQSVACLLVEEDDKLVGVFSDRDALNCVALEYEEKKNLRLREVMTADPVYVHESDSSAAALSVMAVMGHRHVPVLNSDGKIMGIVSPNRVSAFLLSLLKE